MSLHKKLKVSKIDKRIVQILNVQNLRGYSYRAEHSKTELQLA